MRLVIHAGFGKCGSSAIQFALAAKQAELRRRSIFLFGEGLTINYRAPRADHPFWRVAAVFRDPEERLAVPARLLRELNRLGASHPNATAVLSAENLSESAYARLFKGFDERCETTIVFYIRPQHEWIPSAWKQWGLKSGAPLAAFVKDCLEQNAPDFRRSIEGWAAALPNARIVVRVLGQAVAENGGPASDFFQVLGLGGTEWQIRNARANPSVDFALLNILNENPWLFQHQDDNEPFKALLRILPERHLGTNIKMLRLEDEKRIATHFASDNLALLETYCGSDAASIHETYFQPRDAGRAYEDVDPLEMVERGLGIMLEVLIERVGAKPILRPPYWKIPLRIAERLRRR